MSELLSVRQAAHRFGVGERRLRQAVRSGEIPGYQFGKRWIRVKTSEVNDWIQDQRVRIWTPKKRR